LNNSYLKDSVAQAKLAAIPIAVVINSNLDKFVTPVLSDVTSNPSTGVIERTIEIDLTADFLASFPTDNQQRSALKHLFETHFQMQFPGSVEENLNIVA